MPALLFKPHTVTRSWTQEALEAEPGGGGEAGPCPGRAVGQGTQFLEAQGLLPFPQVGMEATSSQSQPCSAAPTSLPAWRAQGKRHIPPFPPESTSGAATDTQPSSLCFSCTVAGSLHSRVTKCHLSPGLSDRFLHPSLQRHVWYVMDSSL